MGISCKKLTIFEGPDGSGKTTAAKTYAIETGAKYVHFGPVPHVKKSLARLYVEAMLPALLGYQDVVFDRSWLSEVPYGTAFRGGVDRLGDVQRRMLARLAMRCGAMVINCRPSWTTVCQNYKSRKEIEMLDNEQQLRQVFDLYGDRSAPVLPYVNYDYTQDPAATDFIEQGEWIRTLPHLTSIRSAGNLEARVVVVGENFAELKEQDPFYQWPFASFNGSGCSQWFTQLLTDNGITENSLLWVNSDQDIRTLLNYANEWVKIISLGDTADAHLEKLEITHTRVAHPQAWKRFHASEEYGLIKILKEELR